MCIAMTRNCCELECKNDNEDKRGVDFNVQVVVKYPAQVCDISGTRQRQLDLVCSAVSLSEV